MTVEQIVILVLVLISMSLVVVILFLNKLLRKAGADMLQVLIDKMEILKTLEKELEKNSLATKSTNEEFIKFLSQSRDWAFSYIEDAQEKLLRFDSVMQSVSKTYDGKVRSSKPALDQVLEAYKEIETLLPEDE